MEKALKPDKYKDVIVNSLRFLVQNGRIAIYGFVIMDNHIHIVWHLLDGNMRESVQQSFLKYTAQQIKFNLVRHHSQVLAMFKVEAKDRGLPVLGA